MECLRRESRATLLNPLVKGWKGICTDVNEIEHVSGFGGACILLGDGLVYRLEAERMVRSSGTARRR